MATGRVLLVEDEPRVRAVVRRSLASRGYVVDEVTTCREAEEAARRMPTPDVAVLDYDLPDGDALQLLPRLRAADPTLPAIILTGHGSIDLAVRALHEGADHFLTKPVELAALGIVVERLLDQRRA